MGDGSPPVGSRSEAEVGGLEDPRSRRFLVNECLNFDVLEEKNSKTAKRYHKN